MKRSELLGLQINKVYINNSSCVWSTSTVAIMDTSVLSSTMRTCNKELNGTWDEISGWDIPSDTRNKWIRPPIRTLIWTTFIVWCSVSQIFWSWNIFNLVQTYKHIRVCSVVPHLSDKCQQPDLLVTKWKVLIKSPIPTVSSTMIKYAEFKFNIYIYIYIKVATPGLDNRD